jgi:hypothetical protein
MNALFDVQSGYVLEIVPDRPLCTSVKRDLFYAF